MKLIPCCPWSGRRSGFRFPESEESRDEGSDDGGRSLFLSMTLSWMIGVGSTGRRSAKDSSAWLTTPVLPLTLLADPAHPRLHWLLSHLHLVRSKDAVVIARRRAVVRWSRQWSGRDIDELVRRSQRREEQWQSVIHWSVRVSNRFSVRQMKVE